MEITSRLEFFDRNIGEEIARVGEVDTRPNSIAILGKTKKQKISLTDQGIQCTNHPPHETYILCAPRNHMSNPFRQAGLLGAI